jgi:7-carboxy-7-deazaguanine synthase
METRPAVRRKVEPVFLALGGRESYAVVEDVRYAGPAEIISIETSLGTYISDGILSRNCDSKFAVLPEYKDQWRGLSAEEVFAEIERLSGGEPILVTLSGGNPAIQPLGELINLGHQKGYTFAIETQGTIYKDWFPELDYLTVSPKPPSSGMKTDWDRLTSCLDSAGEHTIVSLKVVVFDDADYEYAREVGRRHPETMMYLQVGNDDPPGPEPEDATEPDNAKLLDRYEWLVEKVLADGWNEATVLPQLHVLLWGNKRGV